MGLLITTRRHEDHEAIDAAGRRSRGRQAAASRRRVASLIQNCLFVPFVDFVTS